MAGLFGQNPNDILAAQQAADEASAVSKAGWSPDQWAGYAQAKGGQMAGRGVRGLLGIEDPMLKELAVGKAMMEGVDLNDPAALENLAKAYAEKGLHRFGEEAYNRAQTIKKQQADLEGTQAKTKADIAKSERETAMAERALADARRLSREEGFKNLPPEVQTILLMEQRDPEFDAKKAMQDYLNKKGAKQFSDPYQRGGAWVQRDLATGEEKQVVSRAPVTNVNTGGGGANKPLTLNEIKYINTLKTEATVANNNVTKADELIGGLERGVAKFGAGSNAASSLRTLFGSSTEGDRFKQNVERFTTAAVNAVLNMAKGAQTEGDAQRARDQIMTALQKNDTNAVIAGLKELRRIHDEIATVNSESLTLVGQERGRDVAPKKNTAKPGTKENPIPLD